MNKSYKVILPYQFQLRPYQEDNFRAYFIEGKKRIINVWHRRAGKTLSSINFLIAAAMTRVGTYYHAYPQQNQVRRAIWEGKDNNGRPYLDYIPKSLLACPPKNKDMRLILPNGSDICYIGSDMFDKKRGVNFVGLILDEYSFGHPGAWEAFRPILASNGGWAMFVYTPNGKNHGYELLQQHKDDPMWHVSMLTAEETFDYEGNRVLSQEILEQERKSMSEPKFMQEYYVSFDGGIEGAYYAEQLKIAYQQSRIRPIHADPRYPVYTFWDVGFNDPTAIWFMQMVGSELRFINYYEATNEGVDHFANYVHNYGKHNNLKYASHFGPFDLQQTKQYEHGGKTTLQMYANFGIQFRIVPKPKQRIEGINAARLIFPRCHFDEVNCKIGIRALQEYHRKYNEMMQCYSDSPVHNWASHGADAFRYFALSFNQMYYQQMNKLLDV